MAKRPNAVGRPPTSGTRHGNGKGRGGPAKGAGSPAETIQTREPFEPGNTLGAIPPYRATAKAERLTLLREAAWADAFNPAIPVRERHAIRADLLNREEGLPVARVVQTDDANAWFVEGVPEAKSAEEWQQQHGLATATPRGHGD